MQNIIPSYTGNFKDSEGVFRPVKVFEPKDPSSIKGTIALLLGGYLDEKHYSNIVIVGTKGWSNSTIRPVTEHESTVIAELVGLGWRILIFESMQFAKPDGTTANELWIEDYLEWIGQQKFSEQGKKVFMIGFSSGAYIVGLHLKHLSAGEGKGSVSGYGIFSYSLTIGSLTRKTDFSPEDFKTPTLFLSGSCKLDIVGSEPDVNGYGNTKWIYDNCACKSNARHGWEALNSRHSFFYLESPNGKRAATNIINDWFSSYYSQLAAKPRDETELKDDVPNNPAGCN